MHHPVRRHRRIPAIGLVDPLRRAVIADDQILRPEDIAKRRAGKRRFGGHLVGPAGRLGVDMWGLGIGRLEAEPAGRLDRAKQKLQHMQRAAGLEAVRMRRNSAHGMHRDRPADHAVMLFALPVGPGLLDHHFLFKGGLGQIGRQLADPLGRDANLRGHRFRRVIICQIGLGHQREGRHGDAAALHLHLALQRDLYRRIGMRRGLAARAIQHQRRAVIITKEQPVIRLAGVADDKPGGVGVAAQIIDVDLAGAHQFANKRQDQQAVGAGCDAIPVIGNRGIAGLYRIHRDHPRATGLQLAKPDLDRVGIMILGNAEQDEELGQVPIGRSELPEGAAKRIDSASRHIDRTEPAMGGKMRGAELLCPPARQGL